MASLNEWACYHMRLPLVNNPWSDKNQVSFKSVTQILFIFGTYMHWPLHSKKMFPNNTASTMMKTKQDSGSISPGPFVFMDSQPIPFHWRETMHYFKLSYLRHNTIISANCCLLLTDWATQCLSKSKSIFIVISKC